MLSQFQLQQYLDLVGTFIVVIKADQTVSRVNRAGCQLLGYREDEIVGKNWFDHFLPTRDRESGKESFSGILHCGNSDSVKLVEHPILTASGEERLLAWRVVILKDSRGNVTGVISSGEDITELQRINQALRESEERHRMSQIYGGIGAWESDLLNNQHIWSENCSKILGIPFLPQPTWEDFLIAVHPEDRSVIINATNDHIEHNIPYNVEYRITDEDGQIRWLRSVGQVERDGDGKPVRMRGIVEDVTDRVLLSKSLEESEKRYRALMENASDAIVIGDEHGNLEEINRSGELLLGYTRDEIRHMNVVQIHPAEEMSRVKQHLENVHKLGSVTPLETRIVRKDGKVIDIEIRPSRFEMGGRKVAQGIFIDRTHRIQHEQLRIAEEKAHRDTLVREVHHRIKNNLQGVTGVLRQFADNHPELAEPLHQAISQVQSVAVIHGLQGRASLAKVRICELTIAISDGIKSLWQKPIAVYMPHCNTPCMIAEEEAVPLALILNELISNAVKHCKRDGNVSITLSQEPRTESIKLTIQNDGQIPDQFGLEHNNDFGTGLHLVESLLPRDGATLLWKQQGNKVITTLQLEQPTIRLESINHP